MLKKYNPEHNEYTRYIPVEQMDDVQENLLKIKERLKNTPVKEPFKMPSENELDEIIDINSVEDVKRMWDENAEFNIDAPINYRYASFLLVAAYFGKNLDVIKYLIEERGASVHRVDVFGYNAIMSVVMNENMEIGTKLETITYLISKGCDVNWLTCAGETALLLALHCMEFKIANLLLDNGAVVYKDNPTKQ